MAARESHVEVLEKLWEWAKELQLKPEDFRKDLWLSKDKFNQTPWHMAAERWHIEVLEKVCNWDKELQVNPEELKKEVWLSTDNS